ncbi:MAG: Flp family type IVb pilin [Chloroflexi bacterium]|nr:Flp family type IVb pilin [Chloroflexota bacterium]
MHYTKLARALLTWTREAEGQALAEYGLILAVVVVAAVAGLALIGGAVSTPFSTFVEATGIGGS